MSHSSSTPPTRESLHTLLSNAPIEPIHGLECFLHHEPPATIPCSLTALVHSITNQNTPIYIASGHVVKEHTNDGEEMNSTAFLLQSGSCKEYMIYKNDTRSIAEIVKTSEPTRILYAGDIVGATAEIETGKDVEPSLTYTYTIANGDSNSDNSGCWMWKINRVQLSALYGWHQQRQVKTAVKQAVGATNTINMGTENAALGLKHEKETLGDNIAPKKKVVKIAFFDTKPFFQEYFDSEIKSLNSTQEKIEYQIEYIDVKLNEKTARLAEGCQSVCVFVHDTVNAATATELKRCGVELIALRCAGFNQIHLKSCDEKNLSVVRVPAYSPHAVAEHTLALLLSLNRHIPTAYMRVRDGNYSVDGLVGFDLYGKTVGVVGMGKIGRCVTEILNGFGCKVLCYDVKPNHGWLTTKGYTNVKYVSTLEEIYTQSDIISLHAPLSASTKHMINTETIAKMKKGVILLNTSRGPLIQTEALIAALKNGNIGGCGLDTYENESDLFMEDWSDDKHGIPDALLLQLSHFPQVIITAHQGFLTVDALKAIAKTTMENVNEYFVQGKKMEQLTNTLNKLYVKGEGKPKGKQQTISDQHHHDNLGPVNLSSATSMPSSTSIPRTTLTGSLDEHRNMDIQKRAFSTESHTMMRTGFATTHSSPLYRSFYPSTSSSSASSFTFLPALCSPSRFVSSPRSLPSPRSSSSFSHRSSSTSNSNSNGSWYGSIGSMVRLMKRK